MDFDDDDEARGAEEPQAPTVDVGELQKRLDEAEKRNFALRDKVRRIEFTAEYGEEIVSLIPEGLASEAAKDLAEKLKAKLTPVQETDPTGTTEPEVQAEPEPTGLAAVAKGPAPGSAAVPASAEMSAKELGQLAMEDPAAFSAAIAAKYRDG